MFFLQICRNNMLNPDALFARNMTFAGSVKYDLKRVHGFAVAESLSVCLRTTAAVYEDDGKVLLANVPERAKQGCQIQNLKISSSLRKIRKFSFWDLRSK